jgi:hypothetical protein
MLKVSVLGLCALLATLAFASPASATSGCDPNQGPIYQNEDGNYCLCDPAERILSQGIESWARSCIEVPPHSIDLTDPLCSLLCE